MKGSLSRLYRWEYFWLCVIVIATLAMHFSIITNPNDLILDEQHYVKDARSIIATQVDQRPEHPPLSKLFIVGGMDLFGDNPFGWRVFPIIFGTISLILFYFICRKLNMSRRTSSLAVFLLGLDNFTFLMSSIAMLDVFFVTLTMAFFLLYLYREYFLSGVFIGLASLGKLFAVMAAPTLLIHWIFSKTRPSRMFILTIITAPFALLAFLSIFDFALTRHFTNPISRIQEMLSLSSTLTFYNTSHPALSRPWEWLLSYRPMAFWYSPHYTGAINPSLWALMIPIVLYMLYRAIKRNDAGLFGFAWFFGTYVLWIPISIMTNRVSFVYYFYPTVGALCIGLAMAMNEATERVSAKPRKIKIPVMAAIIALLLFHIASFVYLTPVFIRT